MDRQAFLVSLLAKNTWWKFIHRHHYYHHDIIISIIIAALTQLAVPLDRSEYTS